MAEPLGDRGNAAAERPARGERRTHVAVLGSTGSIGRSALDVIEHDGGRRLAAWGLAAQCRWEMLAEQAKAVHPRYVAVADLAAAAQLERALRGTGVEVLGGPDGVIRMVQDPETDRVLSAIVGAVGLRGTWAALEAGKIVALANKETLVVAGPLVMDLARSRGGRMLAGRQRALGDLSGHGWRAQRTEVRRVILTSSGGPFRGRARRGAGGRHAAEDASKHPTWQMGPKITIDSATLMNKALEVIEARWLFDLEPDQVEVVIHPESVVHSMVEFVDGSVIAQLSPPDMRLPIQYALTYPERVAAPCPRLDLEDSL